MATGWTLEYIDNMDAAEWAEWKIYNAYSPIGPGRWDWAAANIQAVIANCAGFGRRDPAEPRMFLPPFLCYPEELRIPSHTVLTELDGKKVPVIKPALFKAAFESFAARVEKRRAKCAKEN